MISDWQRAVVERFNLLEELHPTWMGWEITGATASEMDCTVFDVEEALYQDRKQREKEQ